MNDKSDMTDGHIRELARSRVVATASKLVRQALKDGALVRKEACERCGRSGVMLDAAHADYSRPLDVFWLCRKCHTKWDHQEPKTLVASEPFFVQIKREVEVLRSTVEDPVLSERIRLRLHQMDRNQKWLAKVLQRDESTVSRWLDGSRPMTVAQLHRVAIALHRPPAWFLSESQSADDDRATA